MSNPNEPDLPSKGQLLVYRAEDGRLQIDVRLENETVWLTQQHMADLFQTTKQNVSLHLQNIFKEGELQEDSVVKESLTTASDGKNYQKKYYNLDAIVSVGYRVKSAVATRFRIWATQKLREYIVKHCWFWILNIYTEVVNCIQSRISDFFLEWKRFFSESQIRKIRHLCYRYKREEYSPSFFFIHRYWNRPWIT